MLRKASAILLVLCLLSWLTPVHPTALAGHRAEVDPQVWADAAQNGEAEFFLVLSTDTAQAAEDAAQNATTRGEDRTAAVFYRLRDRAAQSQTNLISTLKSKGVRFQAFWLVNAIAVRGDAALIQYLSVRPEVIRIAPNAAYQVPLETAAEAATTSSEIRDPKSEMRSSKFEINYPLSPSSVEWNLTRVNAPALWSQGNTGQGIVYAIADTGVQWDHPALKSQYRGWAASLADHNFNWWDAIHAADGWPTADFCPPDQTSPCDDYGHGTHALGIGVGDDSGTNQVGVAPGAKWIGCRNMYYGVGHPSTYIECLEFFIAPWNQSGDRLTADPARHAHVVANSYSCTVDEGCPSDLLHSAVQAVRAAGIFMSVSAGNKGSACGSVNDPPGNYPESFTVGNTNSANIIAASSSRGPATFGGNTFLKPELSAPGSSIRSSVPTNGYGYKTGTSMAAPHVAGAVALLWSAYPPLRGNVTVTETVLKSSATPLFTTEGCGGDTPTSWPNNTYGYGLLNIQQAYQQVMPNRIFYPVARAP